MGGPWEKITVHHSDAVGSLIFNGSASESRAVVKAIQRHHQTEKGWGDIGYHFLIDARGRVFEGRSLSWQGALAGDAKKNRRNIGVCLLGNFEQNHPTQAARDALSDLLDGLRGDHHIPRKGVYLHSEMTSTDCPGRHLSKWVDYYRTSP